MSIKLNVKAVSRNVEPETRSTAVALTKDTLLALSSGKVIPATSSTVGREIAGLALADADIISPTVDAPVDVERIIPGAEYSFDTTNNSNAVHNGQLMILSSAGVVNNTGTTSATGFIKQLRTVGVAADKKIIGTFVGV